MECLGVPLMTSDGCAHQVRRCESACVPSTPDTYVGSRSYPWALLACKCSSRRPHLPTQVRGLPFARADATRSGRACS